VCVNVQHAEKARFVARASCPWFHGLEGRATKGDLSDMSRDPANSFGPADGPSRPAAWGPFSRRSRRESPRESLLHFTERPDDLVR